MRKSTTYHYAEGDVKKIIKDEFKHARAEWVDEITKRVTESVTERVTESVTDSFTQKITQFKSDILDGIDKVMGELVKIREEQEVSAGKLSEHSDILEDHETRLGKVEKTLQSA